MSDDQLPFDAFLMPVITGVGNGELRPLSVIQQLDLSAARCLRCRLELMVKQRPKLKILVTMSTAIAIAIATKIYGATSGTIGGASRTTGATISSNQYNCGAN